MHPVIYSRFRRLVADLQPTGSVLEVGAVLDSSALLAMPELQRLRRIGVNLRHAGSFGGFEVVRGNSNDMSIFADGTFDLRTV